MVATVRAKPEYYREQAERCRNLAEEKHLDADAKAHLLDVAGQYDRLALEAERRT
jgi:hypothetical protein